jgi:hypothetical protein
VQLLIAEFEPEHFEVKGLWLRDFLQAEDIAVEVPGVSQIGDENGHVIDLGN